MEEGFAQSEGEVPGHEELGRDRERKGRAVTRGKWDVETKKWREIWEKTQREGDTRNGKVGGKLQLIPDSTGNY